MEKKEIIKIIKEWEDKYTIKSPQPKSKGSNSKTRGESHYILLRDVKYLKRRIK